MSKLPLVDDSGPLKLTSLEVENILRLRACSLTMNGEGALIIEGGNEEGKSSVLKSLEILLAGMSTTPDEPIHGDEEKGKIVGTFGDVVVTKTFARDKRPALRISSKGARFGSPQKILDSLLDHVALDPLKFAEQDAKAQLATLSDLMGVDETELNSRRQEAYEQRRESNRVVRELEGTLKTLDVDPKAPAEEISVSDLMAELDRIRGHNTIGESLEAKHDTARRNLEGANRALDEARQALCARESAVAAAKDFYNATAAEMTAFEPLDEDEIKAKIATVDETNRKVRTNAEAKKIRLRLESEQKSAEAFDQQLADIDQEIGAARMEAHARLPVAELSLTDDGVYYKGKPLAQAGSSAQLRVSVAVAIALNKDKRIRLLLVDDAEKLDKERTRLVLEMARDANFQVILARVGSGGDAAVLIEDGTISNA